MIKRLQRALQRRFQHASSIVRPLVLVTVTTCLLTPSVQAASGQGEEHPFYQSLLDMMNSSERFLFEKRSYQRSESSAVAVTDVYDLSPDATSYQLFSLHHQISYPQQGALDISSTSNNRQPEISITTTLDVESLSSPARALVTAIFADESPFEITSRFTTGAVEHSVSVSSAYMQEGEDSMSSEGLHASLVAQQSGALAAYAALEQTSMMTDDVSLQLEQMLLALNIVPLGQGEMPLFEFSFNLPGAVRAQLPISDWPVGLALKDTVLTMGLRYEQGSFGAGISASVADVMMPFLPVQGANISMNFYGLSANGKKSLERFLVQAYADDYLSDNEQASFIALLRSQVIAPGLGLSIESGFKSYMGDAKTRLQVRFNDEFHEAPSQWRTRADLLRNVSATFTADGSRMLYNLIPASMLPEPAVVDQFVVLEGGTASVDMQMHDSVVWINDEPMSLSLILADELQAPLWPDSVAEVQPKDFNDPETSPAQNEFNESGTVQHDEVELAEDTVPQTATAETDAIAALEMKIRALEAERTQLQQENLKHKTELDAVARERESEERELAAAREQTAEEKLFREQSRNAREQEMPATKDDDNARLARQRQTQLMQLRSRYFNALRQRVESRWRKPPGIIGDVDCTVSILQNISGEVQQVLDVECVNGTAALRKSVENAVLAASPMPQAPDQALFDSRVKFYFRPG